MMYGGIIVVLLRSVGRHMLVLGLARIDGFSR